MRAPAHFPEVGFEPGGLLEDRDQLCLPGRRGVEIGKTFEVRPRFRRDLLVGCTGILGDPNAIWVRCSERIASPELAQSFTCRFISMSIMAERPDAASR